MMRFQPLGYRFECRTSMAPATARAAIRQKKKSWFAPQNGPRGWIAGPIMCLWLSAFDQCGPMVIGVLKRDGSGTRVIGRAGADLNGTAMFILLAPLMAWVTYKMAEAGQGSLRDYLFIGVIFGLGLPLTLWISHSDRSNADPIVDFISIAIKSSKP